MPIVVSSSEKTCEQQLAEALAEVDRLRAEVDRLRAEAGL